MNRIAKVRIGNRLVGDGEPTFIIAEIASNFDRSMERAKKLIELAANCGADAVKFQLFEADKLISKESFTEKISFQSKWKKSVYQVYKDAELPREWIFELKEHSEKMGVIFFSTVVDEEGVDLLHHIGVPAFKIPSHDIDYLSFLEYVAKKGKPMIVSTGESTLGEIEATVNTVRNAGNNDLILLQCVTNYPSPIEQANIRAMITLRRAFQVPVGYSDHTLGSVVPLGAVALGACVIEKHFTDDKTREGPDHSFSMTPDEFKKMVDEIRLLEKALGSYEKKIMPAEFETFSLQRRSIYAKLDIKKGMVLTKDMLICQKPRKGLSPSSLNLVIGRKAREDIKKGMPITWEDIV